MTERTIPTTYDPQTVESKWYKHWEKEKFFHAEVNPEKPPFCIVIPPPNVTGSLHLGHALDNTLQDILIRFRRMQGFEALWVPGTDHAGIATQARVEEYIAKDGLTKYDLGREEFLERVWGWKEQYGSRIIEQLKRLGTSCDWERTRFTMDEGCSRAVQEVFVRLYKKGLIYRGSYIINWCPKCHTTISDIEVEHEPKAGKLYYVKYPIKDVDESITVATTRPETILGDTAVAVHPEDKRYRHLIGKTVILPVIGREIPIVADTYVDMEFGTGAVKITPAHDPNDFEVGLRHNLPRILVINKDATMNETAGKYAGMDRYECRDALVNDLREQGYLVKIDEHEHAVGQCYRCDTVVEPLVSQQWFVKMKDLAEPAIQAARDGRVKFIPERFTKIYLGWLENIRDWCISRQLWWGHRIPVWYCQDCGELICQKEAPSKCPECTGEHLEQESDVLDTWFSSALWPFSTLGWPEKTPELDYFYPTSVLVTGRDIIFFWVARMIFMALEFMEEVPFREVFIHGLVLDALGRKMSKSLGNGVDPIEVIDQYGADTLRFMLITGNTPGNDLRFHFERLEAARNFANKIWNASRFVMLNLDDFRERDLDPDLSLADRWIISRYNKVVAEATRLLEKYELGEAARTLYDFIWGEFCDWYIEIVKPSLYGKEDEGHRETSQFVLSRTLSGIMQLLHPFMPFITEEIWQHLPHEGQTIMKAEWPKPQLEMIDDEAEAMMALVMDVTKAIRNLRAEMCVPPGKKAEAILVVGTRNNMDILTSGISYIQSLANVSGVEMHLALRQKPPQAATAVVRGVEVYLPLKGLIDLDREAERLEKEVASLEKELVRVQGKLRNEGFLAKAPAEVVAKERDKEADLMTNREALKGRLSILKV